MTIDNVQKLLTLVPKEGFLLCYGPRPTLRWKAIAAVGATAIGVLSNYLILNHCYFPLGRTVLAVVIPAVLAVSTGVTILFRQWNVFLEPSRQKLLAELNPTVSIVPGGYLRRLFSLKTDDTFKIELLKCLNFPQLLSVKALMGDSLFNSLLQKMEKGNIVVQLYREGLSLSQESIEAIRDKVSSYKAFSQEEQFRPFMLFLRQELIKQNKYNDLKELLQGIAPFLVLADQPMRENGLNKTCSKRVQAHLEGVYVAETLEEWIEDLQFAGKHLGPEGVAAVELGFLLLDTSCTPERIEKVVEGYLEVKVDSNLLDSFKHILWQKYTNYNSVADKYPYAKRFQLTKFYDKITSSIKYSYSSSYAGLQAAFDLLSEEDEFAGFPKFFKNWTHFHKSHPPLKWLYDTFYQEQGPKADRIKNYLKETYRKATAEERLEFFDPLDTPDELLELLEQPQAVQPGAAT